MDVAERKNYWEKVKQQAEEWELILNSISDFVFILDNESRIIKANTALISALHLKPEEVIGKKCYEIMHKSDKPWPNCPHQKTLRDKISHTEEVDDQNIGIPLLVTVSPIFNDKGEIAGSVHIAKDITESKKTEEALGETNEYLENLINYANAPIIIWDQQLRITRFNHAFEFLTGRSADDVIGKPIEMHFPANLVQSSRELITKAMKGERLETVEINILHLDGSVRAVLWNSATLFAPDGKTPVATIAQGQDITKRKRAEEDLKKTLKLEQEISLLQRALLAPRTLNNKLKTITDGVVRILGADLCRIWLIRPGDMCGHGCIHAEVKEGSHVCRFRDKCLHLMASSGRYTHIDGKGHARIPFGCYKIGLIASGEEDKFLTNDVVNDPRVHNHEWARELGLVFFAGYQLRIPGGEAIGVLALFAKHALLPVEDALLDSISISTAVVAQEAVAEEALKESESKFRTIIEGSNEGIIFCDEVTMSIIFGNAAMSRLLGYSREELAGMTIQNLHPKDDWDSVRREFKRHVSGEISSSANIPVVRKDGDIFFTDINSACISVGGKRYFTGFFRDITKRKRAEEALRESENKYRGLFESSRDAIMTLEPPSWKFTSGNPATMEMFRVRNAEELSNLGPWNLSPERQPDGRASAEKAREMIETAMREGTHSFEWTHKRLDGGEFPATVLLTRMNRGGKAIIQATVRDTTARKEIEKRLMMAERLAAVGTFVAGAGHELNNPLACVIGFSQLALGNLKRGKFDRKELIGALEKVASNADRCRAILSSLLACGRGYSLQLAPVDLHKVIDEAIELAGRQSSFAHVTLSKNYSLEIPPVFGNRDALLKVLVNVAINACHAMEGRGALKVATEREDNWVRVIFQDNGVGIRKENLHKVFDPFFSTKEVGKGAGLGLAVCIGIVKSHDGDITVQSDGEGRGTKVIISLPVEKRGGYEKE